MTLTEFCNRAITVPFVDLGRDYDGWDCYGLVYCGLRDVFGIHVPAYNEGYTDAARTAKNREALDTLITNSLSRWQKLPNSTIGSVVLLRLANRPIHIGLMTGRRTFLHAEAGAGTNAQETTSPLWSKRIEGYYQYVG